MRSTNSVTPKIVGALAIAIVAGAGGYLFFTGRQAIDQANTITDATTSSQVTTTPATSTTPTTDTTTPAPTSTTTYKDGAYSVTKQYSVPGGARNTLAVTLTIANDIITAVTSSNVVQERESQQYVDSFRRSINSAVVGTNLTDAYVGRVGGASLTSNAFNNAIDSVISGAKA